VSGDAFGADSNVINTKNLSV